jgi:hypothetical protein
VLGSIRYALFFWFSTEFGVLSKKPCPACSCIHHSLCGGKGLGTDDEEDVFGVDSFKSALEVNRINVGKEFEVAIFGCKSAVYVSTLSNIAFK